MRKQRLKEMMQPAHAHHTGELACESSPDLIPEPRDAEVTQWCPTETHKQTGNCD